MDLPTPVFSSQKFGHFFPNTVYEPAEDTFLLLDALQANLHTLKPLICLEVGSGSGAVIVALKKALGLNCICLATDVNEYAGECTLLCAKENGIQNSIEVVLTDVTSALATRLANSVDLLIFNPPYVATDEMECNSRNLAASWAGGKNGMQVVWRFVEQAVQILSPHGQFYLVLEKVNDPFKVMNEIESKYKQLGCQVVLNRKCGIEHLYIIRGEKEL